VAGPGGFTKPEGKVDAKRARQLVEKLLRRFKGATFEMLEQVLLPLEAPITKVDRTLRKVGKHKAGTFEIAQGSEHPTLTRGRSGKVVPRAFADRTADWKELIKARIHDAKEGFASGELHYAARELADRLARVNVGDILEIDRYGITAKLESALTEAALVAHALERGYAVTRLPEDIARHLGEYYDCDFLFERKGVKKRVESKSLWGTDTSKARLIHSVGGRYETSSCKFATQDIFAVNLWLRSGCVTDIAFARSVLKDDSHPYGLPPATKRRKKGEKGPKVILPDYVGQNPECHIGDGVWYGSIDDVWNLL
jgi:hypothetical protein